VGRDVEMCCGLEGVQLLLSDSHYVSVSLSEDSRDGTSRLSTSLAKIRGSSMTRDSHEAALRILRILRKDSQIRNPARSVWIMAFFGHQV